MASPILCFKLPNECVPHWRYKEDDVAGIFSEYLKITLDDKVSVYVVRDQLMDVANVRAVKKFSVYIPVRGKVADHIVMNGSEEEKQTSRLRFFTEFLDHHNWVILEDGEDSHGNPTIGATGFTKECIGCLHGRPFPGSRRRKRTYHTTGADKKQKRKRTV